MAKKIAKAKKKVKKVAAKKKVVKKKLAKKAVKKVVKKINKKVVSKGPKEKKLGKVDHFFGHLSVAAIKLTAPLKVGDVIHIKGHTTDFTQRVDSLQIEHESLTQAKKGDDIGLKVKDKVREHDVVYLAAEQKPLVQPQEAKPAGAYSDQKFLQF
jgi:putative protease